MKSCVVRELGAPVLAKEMVPGRFVSLTGSSLMVFALQWLFTFGSPLSPNWTMNVGMTRKKRVSS